MSKMTVKPDWERITQEYISTKISIRELSEKYNVPKSNVERRCRENGWVEKRRQNECKVNAKVEEHSIATRAEEILKMQTEEQKKFPQMEALIWKAITEKNAKGELKPKQDLSIKDANDFMNAMQKLQQMKYKSYGIADKHQVTDKPDSYEDYIKKAREERGLPEEPEEKTEGITLNIADRIHDLEFRPEEEKEKSLAQKLREKNAKN